MIKASLTTKRHNQTTKITGKKEKVGLVDSFVYLNFKLFCDGNL